MGRFSRWFLGAVPSSALVSVALVAGVVGFDPLPALQLTQTGTSAWLALDGEGAVALFDGSLPDQAALALLEVASPGADLQVVQVGPGAVVLDRTTGTLTQIDGVSRLAGRTVQVFDDGAPVEALLSGDGDGLWATGRGRAIRIDATTLRPLTGVIELPEIDSTDLAVGGDGRLWYAEGRRLLAAGDPTSASAREGDIGVAAVGPSVVTLDVEHGELVFVAEGVTCELEVSAGATVHGARTAAVIVDPAAGVIHKVDRGCDVVTIGEIEAEAAIGPVVEIEHWLFVTDLSRQRVLMVDTGPAGGGSGVWTDQLVPDVDSPVDLVPVGGVVFYSQPRTGQAGVIEPGSADVVELPGTGGGDRACLVDATLVAVGGTVTASAFGGTGGGRLVDAGWRVDDGGGPRPLATGPTVAVPAERIGDLRISYVVDDRSVSCETVRVTAGLEAGIRPDRSGPVEAGQAATFRSASDDPGSTFAWSVDGPGASIVGSAGASAVTVEFATVGSATLRLTVTRDGTEAEASHQVTVVEPRPDIESEMVPPRTPPAGQAAPAVSDPDPADGTTPANPGSTSTTPSSTPAGSAPPAPTLQPPNSQAIRIESGPVIRLLGATSFGFNYTTNDVCGVGSFTVHEVATGRLVGSHTEAGSCNGPQHGATPGTSTTPGFVLTPDTEYTVSVTVAGRVDPAGARTGTGSATATFRARTNASAGATPAPAPTGGIISVVNAGITATSQTSISFEITTNDVCGSLDYAVVDVAAGVSVMNVTGQRTCGGPRYPVTVPGLEPGTQYDISFSVVGTQSDGVRGEGLGVTPLTRFLQASDAPPSPQPIQVISETVTSLTSTSATFRVVTNDVCGALAYVVFDIAAGVVVVDQSAPSTACQGPSYTFTAPNLDPATEYSLQYGMTGVASDGSRAGGVGTDAPRGFSFTTNP